jgi:hypothetical protein
MNLIATKKNKTLKRRPIPFLYPPLCLWSSSDCWWDKAVRLVIRIGQYHRHDGVVSALNRLRTTGGATAENCIQTGCTVRLPGSTITNDLRGQVGGYQYRHCVDVGAATLGCRCRRMI